MNNAGTEVQLIDIVHMRIFVIYVARRNAGTNRNMKEKRTVRISDIMERMISFSKGNIHDIDHLIRVWTYAKTIGELEELDSETMFILEVAAITHDIACPLVAINMGTPMESTRKMRASKW